MRHYVKACHSNVYAKLQHEFPENTATTEPALKRFVL